MTSTKEPARFIDSAHELAETMRSEALTAPVEGMTLETIEENRKAWERTGPTIAGRLSRDVGRALAERNRLSSAIAAERDQREEQARNERLAGALRDINRRAEDQNIDHVDFRVGARHVTDAALSQEKQP